MYRVYCLYRYVMAAVSKHLNLYNFLLYTDLYGKHLSFTISFLKNHSHTISNFLDIFYREAVDEENNNNISSLLKSRHKRVTSVGGGIIGGGVVSTLGGSGIRRPSGSVKRPLDHVLPCQEIQYLDISYQKVCTQVLQCKTNEKATEGVFILWM